MTANRATQPRAHRDPGFLARKIARLDETHVHPLNEWTRQLRAETGGEVPWFDPDGGGTHARALFLLEAPGARATARTGPRAAASGSGIVSADNNDQTAANNWQMFHDVGLDRSLVVSWNIVPWYLGSTTKIRAANRDDLQMAQPYLDQLIRLLPHLRVILTFGDKARDGWLRYLLRPDAPLLPTLACPHPSPQVLNIHPEYRDLIQQAFLRVKAITS